MNWFKCDENGDILIKTNNLVKLLQNSQLPQIKEVQTSIIEALSNVPHVGGSIMTQEQLNQILTAIANLPIEDLTNAQSDAINALDETNINIDNVKSIMGTIQSSDIANLSENQNNMLKNINTNSENINSIKDIINILNTSLDDSITGVLSQGETSITLTSEYIKEDTDIEVYTSIYNIVPNNIEINDGSITITFDEQNEDMGVKVSFKRHMDWNNVATVTIDGVKRSGSLELSYYPIDVKLGDLPYSTYANTTALLNNEIHLLGGHKNGTKHYKWNGSVWVSVSTLPYSCKYSGGVVLNNELHLLGSYYTSGTEHYKWNGSAWVSVSTLPYSCKYGGGAIILNDEIHIVGGNDDGTKHYKWNGSAWVSVSTLPYSCKYGGVVVLNNEIHILGGNENKTGHYKWNGSEWVSVSTLPYNFYYGSAVVLNNELHLLGSYYTSGTEHYKWNGSAWVSVSTLPYTYYTGSAVVYNNEIHILGGECSLSNHYIINRILYKQIYNS